MEIHDNTFRNPEGAKKAEAPVKAFMDLGGHPLQLNAVNREVLLDAQKHPENHPNLIVRVCAVFLPAAIKAAENRPIVY